MTMLTKKCYKFDDINKILYLATLITFLFSHNLDE